MIVQVRAEGCETNTSKVTLSSIISDMGKIIRVCSLLLLTPRVRGGEMRLIDVRVKFNHLANQYLEDSETSI